MSTFERYIHRDNVVLEPSFFCILSKTYIESGATKIIPGIISNINPLYNSKKLKKVAPKTSRMFSLKNAPIESLVVSFF